MKTKRENFKRLWPSGPLYRGDPVTADSLVLASFAPTEGKRRLCDLGCGSGILSLLLLWEHPAMTAAGVDIRAGAITEAEDNFAANGMGTRFTPLCADLRRTPFCPRSFDLILSNPPYFKSGAGGVSPDGDRARMRTESATLRELCCAAASLLTEDGSFCLIHRTERLAEVLVALENAGLCPVRARCFARSEEHTPEIFCVEARHGASAEIVWATPLYQLGADGAETAEYRKLCHWEGL